MYENPQVRQWVDHSRRKIAIALYNLGDEIQPPRSQEDDASIREDGSPEAAERRRRAREELMERGRIMEERRRRQQEGATRARSFDELVDEKGALRQEVAEEAKTTAVETTPGEETLRKRNVETQGAALGAVLANPFADEMHADFGRDETLENEERHVQQPSDSPATLPATSPLLRPETPTQAQGQHLLIDTDAISNHPSEQLVDLTPTTSASSAHVDLSELTTDAPAPSNYWSVSEWADNTESPFQLPQQIDVHDLDSVRTDRATSESESGDTFHTDSDGDLDLVSDLGEAASTQDSWTEVDSAVSEDD